MIKSKLIKKIDNYNVQMYKIINYYKMVKYLKKVKKPFYKIHVIIMGKYYLHR